MQILPTIYYFKNVELIPETIEVSEVIEQSTTISQTIGNLLKLGEITDLNVLNDDPRWSKNNPKRGIKSN